MIVRVFVLLLCTVMLLAARPAMAGDKAAAQILFDEARKALRKGDVEKACNKFAESHRQDPAVGTLINLARCYEKLGKRASAWVTYKEVVGAAKAAGQFKRVRFARGRAKMLESKFARLRIEVAEPVEGLQVFRGDEEINEQVWGTAVPIDPGEYVLTAEAPGKTGWAEDVTIGDEPDEVTITIPALVDIPKEPEEPKPAPDTKPEPDKPEPEPESDGMAQWVSGWVALSVGVGGVAAGTALRFVALSKDDESLEHCDPNDATSCDAEGVDLRDQAITFQTVSIIGWAAGGALVATGIVLLVTAPSSEEGGSGDEEAALEWLPIVGPTATGLGLRGRW